MGGKYLGHSDKNGEEVVGMSVVRQGKTRNRPRRGVADERKRIKGGEGRETNWTENLKTGGKGCLTRGNCQRMGKQQGSGGGKTSG